MLASANLSLQLFSKFTTNLVSALCIGWPTVLRPKIYNSHLRFSARKWFLTYTSYDYKKLYNEHLCNIGKWEDIWLHLIDSLKHSNQHDQIKIDKVNHCNINDLKKIFIALVVCYNYQNWTSTSRSKYVPLKIMDEITFKFESCSQQRKATNW